MKYLNILLVLILNIYLINANSIDYYISLTNYSNEQLCGSTIENACPSILSALNVIPSSGNKNATLILDDGIYSGVNNTNLNVFGYNIIVKSLNNDSSKVIFDASGDSSASKIFNIFDNGQQQEQVNTQLEINNILFNSTRNGIINSIILNSTFILQVSNCIFNDNSAVNLSVIYIDNSQGNQYDVNATISNSVFNSNSYMLYLENSNLVIDSCSFVGSTAKKFQSASVLFMDGGILEITNTNISYSSVSTPLTLHGLYDQYVPSLIKNCNFDSNFVNTKGGVMAISFSYIIIQDSIFNNNYGVIGGSIFAHSFPTVINILNSNFINCKSFAQGGAISYQNSVGSAITNCQFINNTASSGGSISLEYIDQLSLNNCLFDNNNVTNRGGALYTSFSTINFNQTIIQDNSALAGGAIYCASSTLNMPNNTQISNNYDSGNGTDSYEYNHGVPISSNSFNIYCALIPENTYCNVVSDDDTYSSLCGYVDPNDKDSGLTKGQLAGIIIGATLGAAILAFVAAWLISKTTIGEHYGSLVKNRSDSHDESSIVN